MRTRLLLLTVATLAAASAPAALAAQVRQIRPETLQRLRATVPGAGALTVAGRNGIDTVTTRAPVALRPGELLVVKESGVAAPSVPTDTNVVTTTMMDTATAASPRIDEVPAVAPGGRSPASAGAAPAPPPPAPAAGAAPAESTAVLRLPYTIATADPSAPAGIRYLEARIEVADGGFHYDPESGAFLGRVFIGIIDRDHPGEQVTLSNVVVQILGEAAAMPATLTLQRTSLPFEEVALRTTRPRGDTIRLRLIPSFDPQGTTVPIPVIVPSVSVHAAPVHIAGFGLEKTDLLIEPPFPGVAHMVVTALRAHPDPTRVDVGPTETALVHVRSQGVGTDTILVAGGPYTARVPVVYDLPWMFVLAVIVGGVLGGLLNGLSRKRRTTQRVLVRLALQGVLTGLAVAVLYAAGIKVFAWAPDGDYGEALSFALAFFGGLAGPRIFDRFLPGAQQGTEPGKEEPKPKPAPG